jgi:hypothetical protein
MTNDSIVFCHLLKMLSIYFYALIPEENLQLPSKEGSEDMLDLLLGSNHGTSSPEIQPKKTVSKDGSNPEMESSITQHLLHEDEQDFKVSIRRPQFRLEYQCLQCWRGWSGVGVELQILKL